MTNWHALRWRQPAATLATSQCPAVNIIVMSHAITVPAPVHAELRLSRSVHAASGRRRRPVMSLSGAHAFWWLSLMSYWIAIHGSLLLKHVLLLHNVACNLNALPYHHKAACVTRNSIWAMAVWPLLALICLLVLICALWLIHVSACVLFWCAYFQCHLLHLLGRRACDANDLHQIISHEVGC